MNQQVPTKKYEFLADDPSVKVLPIILSLIIGTFFAMMNETLLNIALTTLMGEFNITMTTVQWMTTGFMLVMGMIMPASALLLQWFTTRQIFLGTMIIFTVGTIICASAPSFSVLLVGRFLQAVGTGLLSPVIFNIFLLLFPPARRGTMLGLIGLVFMFAPAIGPTLSGVIVEYLSWRYLFIFVVPFMIVSILFAYKYLINISEVTKPKIDVFSIMLSTIGFGGLVYGFSSAGAAVDGFRTPSVYLTILIGTISIAAFAIRQLKIKQPLLDLSVFRYPMFRLAVIMYIIIIMSMLASEVILPMYMQGPLMISAASAGLLLLPGSLLNGLLSPVMGKLFDIFGPRKLIIPATILLSATMLIFSQFNTNTPQWLITVGYMMLMVSVSAIMMPTQTNALNGLPKSLYTHGTAVITTLQPVAGAIGVSVFIGLLSSRQTKLLQESGGANPADAFIGGMKYVYLFGLAFAIISFLISLFMRRAVPEPVTEQDAASNQPGIVVDNKL
ncbi:MDR family MFS transporter [Lysinibacillus xylanilyticus]|uniref:MDR family MFS transporter n=1 Tax=Lysinibacillus xylanilyticus TaxID=582475 RepID=UPI00382C2AE2